MKFVATAMLVLGMILGAHAANAATVVTISGPSSVAPGVSNDWTFSYQEDPPTAGSGEPAWTRVAYALAIDWGDGSIPYFEIPADNSNAINLAHVYELTSLGFTSPYTMTATLYARYVRMIGEIPQPPVEHFEQAMLQVSVAATPIPGSVVLFASALGGLSMLGWRRRKRVA